MNLTTRTQAAVLLTVQAIVWISAGRRRGSGPVGPWTTPDAAAEAGPAGIRRMFRTGVVAVTTVVLPVVVIVDLVGRPALVLLVVAGTLIADGVLFAQARGAAAAAARAPAPWPRPTVAAGTGPRPTPPRPAWSALAQPLVVIAITVGYGSWRYPHLPPTLAVHFDSTGSPDRVVATSVGAAFFPVFAQVALTVVIIAVATTVLRRSADVEASEKAGGEAAGGPGRAWSERSAAGLLTLAMCADISLALVALQLWHGGTTLRWPLLVGALTAGLLGAFVAVGRAAGAGRPPVGDRPSVGNRAPTGPGMAGPGMAGPGMAGPGYGDDGRHWRGGFIYHNPDDPKLLVPKRFGIGVTFNFARPMAWVWLAALVALPVASTALAARLGG